MNKTIFIAFISVFLFQCASVPSSSILNEWKEKYKDDDYWYGLAIIDKKNQNNIQEIARNEAINEIASQIKIDIKQDFKRTVKEENFEITDSVIMTLNTRVKNNLEDIEIIDFKDSKDSYMLLARLSKKKYYSSVQRKRENAIKLALEYMSKVNSPSLQDFNYLSKARDAISPYTEYPIYVEYKGQTVNLYTLVELEIENMLSRINIISDISNLEIKSLIDHNSMISITSKDRETDSSISHIPLFLQFNGQVDYCTTDIDGNCTFYIQSKFLSKGSNQFLSIGIDNEKLYGGTTDFNRFSIKTGIAIIPIKILLNIKETNLRNSLTHSYIEPIIKNFLVKRFKVEFTKDLSDFDLLIDVSASTYPDGEKANEYGIYKVFGDATIDIKFSNEQESLIKLSVKKQGVDFNSFENAGHSSLEKVAAMILNETLPELVSILQEG